MIKKWIIKLFKINTYEKEYEKYKELYQNALTDIEVITSVAQNYKRELESLEVVVDTLIQTSEDVLAIVNDPDRKRDIMSIEHMPMVASVLMRKWALRHLMQEQKGRRFMLTTMTIL